MRPIALIVLLAACPAGTSTSPPPRVVPDEPTLAVTTTCVESHREGHVEWTLDASGLPLKQYENSDAAGSQWSASWVRDERGRTRRLLIEMLEGIGAGDQSREMTHVDRDDGSVEERYQDAISGEDVREVWHYDERGRPTRRERQRSDRDPEVIECEYDTLGRVIRRGERRFAYEGNRATPFSMRFVDSTDSAQPITSFRDVVVVHDPYEAAYTHGGEVVRWVGDCSDVFFWPCSPVFAPSRADGSRAERLPQPVRRPHASLEAALQELCASPGCAESIERASGSGSVRSVGLVTIAQGDSEHQSTHLMLGLADGWWRGPQLADGPFNGNQTSGTLSFRVEEPRLMQVVPGGDPELVVRYSTETSNEVEGRQVDVTESGLLICVDLALRDLGCARVPEHIHQEIDGELTEARATLRVVGDGTIAVEDRVGSHERMQPESFPVEWLFEL